jgi:hypothetical protein
MAVATLLVSGCGTSTREVGKQNVAEEHVSSPRPLNGARLTSRAPASLERGALLPVGRTQRVDAAGADLAVTLRRVIDPLRNSGAQLPTGTRAVGVIVQIRSAGPKLYDSSATADISIATSSGAVTPVLATAGICRTPQNDFDRYITGGEDRVGCVVFAVPDRATIDAVRFSPRARARGRLTWAP